MQRKIQKIGYIGREKPLFLAQLFSIKKLQAKAFNMQKIRVYLF